MNNKSLIKTSQGVVIVALCLVVAVVMVTRTWTTSMSSLSVSVDSHDLVAQVAPSATLSLSPASQTVTAGTTFTVALVINTGGQAIYGSDINRLRFNPAVLQVVDADSTAAGVQITPGTLMALNIVNSVDNAAGTIQFSQVADPGSTYTGSGTLASVTFRAVAGGTSLATLDFTLGAGTDSNVAGLGGDLLASVSGGSYTVSAITDATAPSAPGTISLTAISSSQITASWLSSTDNIAVTGYRLERCAGSVACTTFAQVAAPTGLTYTDTGLAANTIYRYRVRAVDAAGNTSAYSAITNATTLIPPDTTPPTISAVTLSGLTMTGVTISWNTNELADTQVEYGLTIPYVSQTTLDTTAGTSHSATLGSLSAGRAYHYRVRSRDAAGNLATSIDNVFTTQSGPDTTAPPVPTGVTATPTSETQIQVSWTATSDPTVTGQTTSGSVTYSVFRGSTLVDTTTMTAYLDSGLTSGSTHAYQIVATDGAGNSSAKSTAVQATTPLLSQAVERRVTIALEGAPTSGRAISGTIEFINQTTGAKVYQSSITTDASGRITISIPSGLPSTVTFRPLITGYISKLMRNIDLRTATVLDINLPNLPAGDFNGDNAINTLDYSYMNSKWGMADPIADINKDGAVNSLDFSYVSNNWMLAGE